MLISNRSEAGSRRERWKMLRLALMLSVMLVCCYGAAEAQSEVANKPASGKDNAAVTAPTGVEKTRARRVEENSTTASTDAASDEAAGEVNSSVPEASSTVDGKGADRLSSLRSQIADAKTDAERSKLQRMLIDYLVALNRKSEAINELRVMSREDRLDPVGFYNIGNALARLGDTDTAIDAYRKAIKQRHDNYSRAYNNLGVLFIRQGRWDDAQEAFLSALRLENFRYGEASYNLGRVYAMRGEADLAIREWSRALVVQPDHTDAAIALARALAEDGSPERGLAVLDSFIARRGPTAELAEARKEILFGGGASEVVSNASMVTPAKVASVTPSAVRNNSRPNAVVRESVNTSAPVKAVSNSKSPKTEIVKSDNGKQASSSLRKLKVDPTSYELLYRARVAREGGRNEEAAKFYRRVLSLNGGFLPPANLELSFVLSAMKRYDEAVATLTTLTSREGASYPIAYYYLGRQYEALGQLNLAAEAYERAANALGESNPQFLLDVSRTREKEGNTAAALVAMESYVRISQKLGRVPDWSTERLNELRQKIGSAAQTPAPKN